MVINFLAGLDPALNPVQLDDHLRLDLIFGAPLLSTGQREEDDGRSGKEPKEAEEGEDRSDDHPGRDAALAPGHNVEPFPLERDVLADDVGPKVILQVHPLVGEAGPMGQSGVTPSLGEVDVPLFSSSLLAVITRRLVFTEKKEKESKLMVIISTI